MKGYIVSPGRCNLPNGRALRVLGNGLLVMCLIWSGVARAATLSVTVLQKGSGDPVPGATVVLATGAYVTADQEGKALLDEVTAPVGLRVMALGYETLERDIQSTARPLTVYLVPQMVQGEGIEVVADRVPEKVSKVPLAREEVRRAPGSAGDPIKTVQSLPGVVAVGDGVGMVFVRGSGAGDNVVWLNGIQVPYLYHFGGLQSVINPMLVQDFNVILGGFPVEYGDQLGGVIDVNLRAPRTDRLHQTYDISTYASSVLLEGPLGQQGGNDGYFLAARRSYVDLLLSPEQFTEAFAGGDSEDPESNQVTTVPRFYDLFGLWHRDYQGGRLDVQMIAASDALAVINNSDQAVDPQAAGALNVNVGYQVLGFDWRHDWGRGWDNRLTASQTRTVQDVQFGTDPTGEPFFSDFTSLLTEVRPEIGWRRRADERLAFGIDAVYALFPLDLYVPISPAPGDVDYNVTDAPKRRIDATYRAGVLAPYVEQRRTWANRLTTTAGLRYSYIKGTAGIEMQGWSPRVSAEYPLTGKTTLTAAWGRYLQMPTSEYLIADFGNPRLAFIKAEHRILGLRRQLDELWSLQLEGYHKPMDDLVVSVNGALPPDNFANAGTGEAYGVDVLLKREQSGRKMGWVSYSYARSTRRDTLTGESPDFSGDQPHSLTLVWSQPLPGDWRKWSWGVKLQTHSGRPYTPVEGRLALCTSGGAFVPCADQANAEADASFSHWRPQYAPYNSARLPSYLKVDLRLDRRVLFNRWKLDFYVEIQNILNRTNVTGYDYGNRFENFDNPRPVGGMPFFPYFGVEASF